MHEIVQRLIRIENQIKEEIAKPSLEPFNLTPAKIIAISKTFPLETIMPLIDHGHLHYGENKVQEAKFKWTSIKNEKPNLNFVVTPKIKEMKHRKTLNNLLLFSRGQNLRKKRKK